MKSDYDVETYAEAFDAHNEFTGAIHPEGLAAEFRGICEDADKEIATLRAALSEALASLDLATSDCILMALAAKRALAKFKDADGEPCRWCGSEEDIHEDHCPAHVLVDIGFVGLVGDETMRRVMEEFVEEENRKFRSKKIEEAAAKARCQFTSCIHGQGVAANGTCHEGDPRDEECGRYRQECPLCHGDGKWEDKTCPSCGGWGYYR